MQFNPILFRHQLHRNPELSGNEIKTAFTIKQHLLNMGYRISLSTNRGTGIVVEIDSGNLGPCLLIRADTDALPIREVSCHSHTSQSQGVMHACGHDGHSASLMSLAYRLSHFTLQRGKVFLVFQPSEETGKGAAELLSDPFWSEQTIHYCFAYHNIPGYPLGQILLRENTFSCASAGFHCFLEGEETHAAYPEQGISPADAAIKLAQGLSTLLPETESRFWLTTLTHLNIGSPVFGSSPKRADVRGTLRSESNRTFERLQHAAALLAASLMEQHRLHGGVEWIEPFRATINHSEANLLLRQACKDLEFDAMNLPQPMRWSEDFAEFCARWPGALFGIGSGIDHPPLHSSNYDFPDALIDVSSKLFEQIIRNMNGLK